MSTFEDPARGRRPLPPRPAPPHPEPSHPKPSRPTPLRLPRRTALAAGIAVPLLGATLTACGEGADGGSGQPPDLRAELPRAEPGPTEGAGQLVVPFTAQMLVALDRGTVNAVCSPLSAQVALSMIGMGAAGQTLAQMEQVLGGTMDELAATANTLSQALATVGDQEREAAEEEAPEPARASLVNGTWVQEGLEIREEFLEDLATWFGSGVFAADFTEDGQREAAREEINTWVADRTNDLIEQLIPPGVLRPNTRLVLVNALHLQAAWPAPLTAGDGTFTTADGAELTTEMLHGETATWYEDELCRATSLGTYGGDLALALVRPAQDLDTVLEGWADAAAEPGAGSSAGLGALLRGLEDSNATTRLTLPAFDISWEASVKELLQELGMTDAFSGAADFSGVTDATQLMITEVLQKAVITVDEEGMEAAAATAVIVGETSAPVMEHELVLDQPFLLVAYHRSTLAPLVVGWIGDPTRTR